jgi:hypothetical protein
MAEELGKGPKAGQPGIGPLYIKQTDSRQSSDGRSVLLPGIVDMLGELSVTSQFKVSLHLTKGSDVNTLMDHFDKVGVLDSIPDIVSYDFFCSDASLPGASFDSSQEVGSRQGIIENFPTKRIYPPFEMTFYVDNEYKIIRLFEEWMNFINPLYSYNGVVQASKKGQGDFKNPPDFFRMRYPDTYKKIISVTKFERDFYQDGTDKLKDISTITYRMIDAYPDQLNSIPVMYEGSIVTKTTVRFLYSRYVIEYNKGNRTRPK